MGQARDVFGSRWWRFDAYEIVEGHLRPAPGSSLHTYGPWTDYSQGIDQGSDARAYMGLVALTERIAGDPEDRARWHRGVLTPENAQALCAWATAHGLLGLGLQRVEQVETARWQPLAEGDIASVEGVSQAVVKTRTRHVRVPGGWVETVEHDTGRDSYSTEISLAGRQLGSDEVPDGWSPGTVIVRDERHALSSQPIEQAWARYFPGVGRAEARTHPYPMPLSDEFWAQYEEPVSDIIAAGLDLGAAAREAAKLHGSSDAELEALDDVSFHRIRRAIEHLEQLAATTTASLTRTDNDAARLQWTGSSLIGLFAVMILLDLTAHLRLHSCTECSTLFVSPSPLATYCKAQCRWRAQKRAQRK